MVHVAAVIGLALLCGAWVLLLRVGAAESKGVEGDCAACAAKRDCSKSQ